MKSSSRSIAKALQRGYAAQAAARADHAGLSRQAPKISRLPSGAVVATLENNSPLSHVAVLYNAGSRFEAPGEQGVSHAIRVFSDQSSEKASGFMLTRNIQQIGSSLTCTSTREHVIFSVSCLRGELETATQFLNAPATKPSFKSWELADNKSNLTFELAQLEHQPNIRVMEALHKAAYRDTLGNSLYAMPHRLGTLTPSLLGNFVSKHFVPGNSAIVGVGVDHDLLMHLFQHKLGWPKEASSAVTPEKAVYHGGEIYIPDGGQFTNAAIAVEGVSLASKDMLPLAVLQHVMGTGPSIKYSNNGNSKVAQAGAQATSNPFAASTINVNYSDSGLFGFYVVAHPQDAGKVMKSIFGQFGAATKGGITEADVQRGKSQLKAATLMNLENGANVLEDMAVQALLTGQILEADAIADAIDKVTLADVQNIARKVINGKPSMAATGDLSQLPYLDQLMS